MVNYNIEVFNDTLKLSDTVYYNDTINLINHTEVIQNPTKEISVINKSKREFKGVEFSYGGTASTAYRYAVEGYHVAMLNFADALEAGGLVLYGEVTQEENICRCTNLYKSITTEIALNNYYAYNKSKNDNIYTDAIIYSPSVCIFKDDTTYKVIEPANADVITCPSPCGGNTKNMQNILHNRIKGIVLSAIAHDVEVLVLGMWGCGAFGQDVKIIGGLFGGVLKEYAQYFTKVNFAIRDNYGGKSKNSSIFEDAFWKGYANGS